MPKISGRCCPARRTPACSRPARRSSRRSSPRRRAGCRRAAGSARASVTLRRAEHHDERRDRRGEREVGDRVDERREAEAALDAARRGRTRARRPRRRPPAAGPTAGRSCGVSGFGGTSPAPPRYLRPATKNTSAIAMPTAATANPAWYPPTARAAPDQERGRERADVDAHVEDREARVAPRVVPVVQLADHARHVGLEQAGAEGHQHDAEERERRLRDREEHVAGGDDDAAVQHRPPCADQPVRQPATQHGQQVDRRRRRPRRAPRRTSARSRGRRWPPCPSGRTAGWRASRSS